MTELHNRIRRFSATLLLASCLGMAIPSVNVMAAPGGMLSTSSSSTEVRGSLVAEDSTAVNRQVEAENGYRHSPWKVAAISAVLPGYGQVYNHAAWKLPIYYGLMAYFAKNVIDDNKKYNDYRSQFLAEPSAATATSRDDYRTKRNTQIVWLCLTYIAGIVDAYVDTQLYDFDRIIDEKVGATVAPPGPAPLVTVSMKF
ncbi:MAG: hypothetical protein HGB02_09365 [Chlorobiaceae bacterium]|nr:hypothetical protein [Chlorobiaceae bacterium]